MYPATLIRSCPQMFYKIGALKKFAKLTGKQLCWSLYLIKLSLSTVYNFTKKRQLHHWCFPVNFVKFSKIAFLQNTFGRLLLHILSQESKPEMNAAARSRRLDLFYIKRCSEKLNNFIGKYLCRRIFKNVAEQQPLTLL